MIAIVAQILKNRTCNPKVKIAILAMKSQSQWYCTYHGVVIAIAGKIERSWRSYSNLSGMIVIAGR